MKARTKTQLQLIIVFIKWKKYSIQKKTEKGNKEKITDELNRKHEQDSSFKFNCIFNYVNCNNWNRPQRGYYGEETILYHDYYDSHMTTYIF